MSVRPGRAAGTPPLRAEASAAEDIENHGDVFFACFGTAEHALRAVAAIQHAVASHDWEKDARVAVRIGLHSGEAGAASRRYLGSTLNRATRVCAAAHVSDHDDLHDLGLRDLGAHELPGFDHPIRLHQLVVPELPDTFPPPTSPAAPRRARGSRASRRLVPPRRGRRRPRRRGAARRRGRAAR